MSDQDSPTGSSSRSSRSSLAAIFSPMNDDDQTTIPPQQPPQSPTIPTTSPVADAPLWFYINGMGYPTQSANGYLIGRGDVCDIRVNDQQVSTRHCQVKNGTLIDCRSTNGTSVNGEILPPNQPHTLKQGDVIYIGSTEIAIRPTTPQTDSSTTPSTSTDPVTKALDLSNLPQPAAEPSSPSSGSQPNLPFKGPGGLGNRYPAIGRGASKTPFVGGPKGRSQFDPAAIASFNATNPDPTSTTSPPTLINPTPSPVYPATPAVGIGLVHDMESQTTTSTLQQDSSLSSSSSPATTTTVGGTFAQSLTKLPTMSRLAGVQPATNNASAVANPAPGPGPVGGGGGTQSTVSGVPNTDEIMNADPSVQRSHIEFLRGEIFRLRRDIMMSDRKAAVGRKKPGMIGGNTFGSDNSDIFKEVIDLKKQMQDLKFVFLYGDDQATIDKAMETEGTGEMMAILENTGDSSGADNKAEIDTAVAQKTQEYLDRIKALEAQLGQRGLELTNLQGTFDLELQQTESRYKDLLVSKDEQLKSLNEAFEKEQGQTNAEWQKKLDGVMLLANETNNQNNAQIDELSSLQDKCQSLEDTILVLEAEKAKWLKDRELLSVGGNDDDGAAAAALASLQQQQHQSELETLRQQLRDSTAQYEKMIDEEVKNKVNDIKLKLNEEKNENNQLMEMLAAIKAKCEGLENQNRDLVKENQDLSSKNSNLEKNNQQMMSNNNLNNPNVNGAVTDQSTPTVTGLTNSTETVLNEKLQLVEKELKERETTLASKVAEISQLARDLDDFKSKVSQLEAEKVKNESQTSQIEQLQGTNAELSQQIKALTHQVEIEAKARDDEIVNLKATIAKLQQDPTAPVTAPPQSADLIAENKKIQALLTQALQLVVNNDTKMSQKDKDQVISDFNQMERFIKTDGLKQSLQAGNGDKAQKSSPTPMSTNDPIQTLKELPPQIIAMIAVPAAILATILAVLIK